jgi:hypothetical protein
MSFLDEQATGQIGIGEKASLSTLTRRKRKRKRGQAPTGAETYSLLPQNEFSNLVSSPTDITQVGIGEKLQEQGTAAGDVPNVFDEYVSAAPRGTTLDAIYYQPPPDDDDADDDDLPSVEDDPYVPDADAGADEDPLTGGYDDRTTEADQNRTFVEAMGNTARALIDAAKSTKTSFEENLPEILGGSKPDEINDETAVPMLDVTGGITFPTSPTPSTVAPPSPGPGPSTTGGPQGGGMFPSTVIDPGSVSGPPGMDASFDAPNTSTSGDWSPGSMQASGGVITKPKSKNKNSFMSMKGK